MRQGRKRQLGLDFRQAVAGLLAAVSTVSAGLASYGGEPDAIHIALFSLAGACVCGTALVASDIKKNINL
jgi:hypothetical protein